MFGSRLRRLFVCWLVVKYDEKSFYLEESGTC